MLTHAIVSMENPISTYYFTHVYAVIGQSLSRLVFTVNSIHVKLAYTVEGVASPLFEVGPFVMIEEEINCFVTTIFLLENI